MNRMMVAILMLLLLSTAACGGGAPQQQSTSSSSAAAPVPPDVIISFEASVDGTTLLIEGQATVPDGALLAYEIASKPFVWDALTAGNVEVKNGKWTVEVDLSSRFPRGQIEIWVAFQTVLGTTIDQPAEIINLYGQLGERITGPQATMSGYLKRAELVKKIEY